jgi:hypothetical protein
MFEVITSISLWELTKHAAAWLSNLSRAKKERKKESVKALRKVVIASRKTSIYLRGLKEKNARSISAEGELSLLWTELGFELKDLGLQKLSDRCSLTGKHWEDPEKSNPDLLEKADAGLERMEQLAQQMLDEMDGMS